MKQTDLTWTEYLQALSLPDESGELRTPTYVYTVDGGGLYRVGTDHFVLIACTHDECEHLGPAMLRRILPATWVSFHAEANPEAMFSVTHYGPPDESC